jgi:DNA-binding PadR family transcriptional regulator
MMPSEDLNLFSYEILGLIGRSGAGAHDLRRMVEHGRLLAWAGESRYYTEPKRLAKLGYLKATREPGATTERTVYRLTPKGLAALKRWAGTPARVTPVRSESLIRLLIADLVPETATRESLAALGDDIEELRGKLEEAEQSAESLPQRRESLHAVYRFLRGYLDLHADLLADLEGELPVVAGKRGGR